MSASETDAAVATMLGRIPSGLFILTCAHEGQETGMLASWVMQAGFEPPSVTVAVKQGRYVADWLAAGKAFVLNTIGEEHKSLISHFGRGFEPGEPAFTGLNITRTAAGLPALADALGHLECRPIGQTKSGDHIIFLAEVLAGSVSSVDGKPYVHLRKNGLKY
ncbi:MAG TPA: flavin reductase family protein [Pirellulales bacterium]|jgi:flavin reductase (DIM6/NTAB) family NADH-FMN oxidoreductase RutF